MAADPPAPIVPPAGTAGKATHYGRMRESLAESGTIERDDPAAVNKILFEAIARKRCVAANYNRVAIRLAPHILYSRHDRLFIDAVTVERDGRPPREIKLGTFQLSGLRDVALDDRPFAPDPAFDTAAEKYAGVTLFAVE